MENLREHPRFGKMYAYVLDNIDAYDLPKDATDLEKINFIFSEYDREYINKDWHEWWVDALEAYLKTMPTCTNYQFTVGYIMEVGKEWGYCDVSDSKKSWKFVNHYYYILAIIIIRARRILIQQNSK